MPVINLAKANGTAKSETLVKIIVTSHNPVKLRAVRNAFAIQFPGTELELLSLAVDAGVRDQPLSDEETRRGARNRIRNAHKACPDADYWVGLEGGLELINGRLLASAWMAIMDQTGKTSEARSPTLPLPPGVRDLVMQGMELGDANDRVFSTRNSKQAGGAFGLLTGGQMTRESVYSQTLILALVPFVNDLYAHSASAR